MSEQFTLGIEEEFQLVDRHTGQLSSSAHTILRKGIPLFGENIKLENQQSQLELVSGKCPDIATAREILYTQRAYLARLVDSEGLALMSAGTHPSARWQDEKMTERERSNGLVEEAQDIILSLLICGFHVHVGVDENKERAFDLIMQLRAWLPHLLALSSNSPFCAGRNTGIKSYRSVIWKTLFRTGLPAADITSHKEYEEYVNVLIETGCISDARKIWWDIRPHPNFSTIEFRIFDMPATIDDAIALAALCQALVAKLAWQYDKGKPVRVWKPYNVEQNKWHAMRWGLNADIVDLEMRSRIPMRDSIRELLDFVGDVAKDLGSMREMDYLHTLLLDPKGTGADQQIAVFEKTNDVQQVVHFLMEQTMQGIQLKDLSPS